MSGFLGNVLPGKCASSGCGGSGIAGGRGQSGYALMAPINYPYYTLRGPRDFLAKNPPSIGP